MPRPRARRGAGDATVPHQKVWAIVDAMAAVMRDLNKEMCNGSARCNRMFQVFQTFQRYIAIV